MMVATGCQLVGENGQVENLPQLGPGATGNILRLVKLRRPISCLADSSRSRKKRRGILTLATAVMRAGALAGKRRLFRVTVATEGASIVRSKRLRCYA